MGTQPHPVAALPLAAVLEYSKTLDEPERQSFVKEEAKKRKAIWLIGC